MRKRFQGLITAGFAGVVIYAFNTSWLRHAPDGEITVLSHRGVHQTFHREGLTNETCTAQRIYAPKHDYLENTIHSFAAAIDYGADMIELDIHPTTDGDFVVFHDWTLECRTDGIGRVRDRDLAYLKTLDIGYGYTADNAKTFPFRGRFIGQIPTLRETLQAFPNTRFMINIKSRSESEAKALLDYIPENDWSRLSVSGAPGPMSVMENANNRIVTLSGAQAKTCVKNYVLKGWLGHMPDACIGTYVPIPKNYRRLIWGWPHRFEQRLNAVGSRSILMGDYNGLGSTGIDSITDIDAVPINYRGIVWTNKVEVTGPYLKSDETGTQ